MEKYSPEPLHDARRLDLSWESQQYAPDLNIIWDVHRAPDGRVCFAYRDRSGQWHELGSAACGQQPPLWLGEYLKENGSFGLGTSWRLTPKRTGTRFVWEKLAMNHPEFGDAAKEFPGAMIRVERPVLSRTHPKTGLPFAGHSTADIRWLNSCFVDVDHYNLGLTFGEAMGQVIDAVDAKRLPPPTAFARSGRGLWIFWFLIDAMNPSVGEKLVHGVWHRPNTPQRASARAMALYAAVQRELTRRLKGCGADQGAVDATRFAPVPGTTKTTVNEQVRWWVQVPSPAYTLDNLAKALGFTDEQMRRYLPGAPGDAPRLKRSKKDVPRHVSEMKKRCGQQRWRYDLGRFDMLLSLRGAFREHQHNRHYALLFYCYILRQVTDEDGNRLHDSEIRHRAMTFARAGCVPSLSGIDVEATLTQARKPPTRGYLSFARFARELKITDAELPLLRPVQPKRPLPTRELTTKARRAAIDAFVEFNGIVPALRTMANYLAELGYNAAVETIRTDYAALNFRNRRGRPRKQKELTQ